MKKLLALLVLLCATVMHAQVSYWFSQWQKKGNAQDAQEFFMWPGTNIYFSYASNHVIINGTGTNVVIATATNALYAQYATNWLGSTNASNAFWLTLTNAIYNATNGFVAGGQTNIYATNLIGLLEGTNVTFTTNASGYLSINSAGGGGFTNPVTPPVTPANLWAWYKLDDATNSAIAIDSGTNYFPAQLVPSVAAFKWVQPGHVGPGSLQFYGSPNYLNSGFLTNIGFNNGTITWWMYQTNAFNDGIEHAILGQTGSEREFWIVHYSNNKMYMGWTRNAGGGFIPDQRLVIDANAGNWVQNAWTHYAFVWSSAGSSFYVNSILQTPTTAPATTMASNMWSAVTIGKLAPSLGGPWYFNGILDDIRIYNTNLTAQEIGSIYGYNGSLDFYVLKSGDSMSGSLSINGTPGLPSLTVYSSGGESLLDVNTNMISVTNLVVTADVMNGPGLILTPPWLASQGGNLLSWTNNDGSVRIINNVRVDQFGNLSTADITVFGTLYSEFGFVDLAAPGGKISGSTNAVFFGDGGNLTNISGTVGLTITQHITDFLLGNITNLYSNGLLVATGTYVVPSAPMIGAGGDTMLGAYGESLEPAG